MTDTFVDVGHPTHDPGDYTPPGEVIPSVWCGKCGRLIRSRVMGVTPSGSLPCPGKPPAVPDLRGPV